MKADHLFWLAIPLLNTLSQLLIKFAAENITGSGSEWLQSAATSPWLIAAIGVEVACFVVWIQVLAGLDLSKAFPLSAVSYILILAVSWLVFDESISPLQLVGSALILAGVWLISTAGSAAVTAGGRRKGAAEAGQPSRPRGLGSGRTA
ncbi:EamA family transporter [Mesorhizobium sp. BAC0120]|uniref:EamA family transporter n=1 Tax=Mesorhizobium sp. BAC0120 TaxID=3090670 RepID=UPI00298C27EE|nr:EamA family transporter [Mesorhizobium sp. BAC0120]MDW6025468.1 EamA family transporter [Mesorhizobium sp. BAC0120]